MTKNIWLVDDDLIWAFALRKMIDRLGFPCVFRHFPDGKCAIDALTEHLVQQALLPHIILLDLRMPVMSGWEFMEAYTILWQATGHSTRIRIYIVSSSLHAIDTAGSEKYTDVGGYLVKPVSKEQLRDIVSSS